MTAGARRPSVLFVDDDQTILDGLASSLWRQRKAWDMTFVCGGPAALDKLRARRFDAIVTDMRMPQIDGEAVLRSVAAQHPGTVRVILSGQTDRAVARRTTAVAHQFLSKPCPIEELRDCLEKMLVLTGALDEHVRDLVCAIGQLPLSARSIEHLDRVFGAPAVDRAELVRCVEADVALAAKLLHVASAGFVALRRPAARLEDAVAVIGTDEVRAVVGTMEVHEPTREVQWLLEHTLATGKLLERATGDRQAFLCGVLHGLGKLALHHRFGARYRDLLARTIGDPALDLGELERAELGVGHEAIAAHLVELWGLSPAIGRVIRHHGRPTTADDDLAVGLHVACALTGGTARLVGAGAHDDERALRWHQRFAAIAP